MDKYSLYLVAQHVFQLMYEEYENGESELNHTLSMLDGAYNAFKHIATYKGFYFDVVEDLDSIYNFYYDRTKQLYFKNRVNKPAV